MIQLNLLPDLKKQFLKAQKTRNRVIGFSILISIIAAGLAVASAVYVYGVQALLISTTTTSIEDKTKKLKSEKDIDKYLTLQNQLAAIDNLHNKKTVYSRLLEYLPVLNPAPPNNVTLTQLVAQSVDEDNTMTFTGQAGTYAALDTFRTTLANANVSYKESQDSDQVTTKLFKNVIVTNSGIDSVGGGSNISFTITVSYDPIVFQKTTVDVALNVPQGKSEIQKSIPVFEGGTQ